MSIQSKFYQVTNQVLLEYQTDQYRIMHVDNTVGSEVANVYMYLGNDGLQYCVDEANLQYSKYPIDSAGSSYYYGGLNSSMALDKQDPHEIYGSEVYINDNQNTGVIIKNSEGEEERKNLQINKDKIRLYLLTGYVMNSISGYSLSVKARVTVVSYKDQEGNTINKRIDDTITLLDWFMPKEELKDRIKWLALPLYLNSKFFDRYIDIEFPSPLDIAYNKRDIDYVYAQDLTSGETIYMRGTIDQTANILIDFSTVQTDHINYVTESIHSYECSFTPDTARTMAISRSSNANNFNARLYEDPETHSIKYYPVYTDGTDIHEQEFDIDLMTAIDQGIISMFDEADLDRANDGMDDFIDMYCQDDTYVYKWVIINELAVTYNYNTVVDIKNNDTETYSEYYTNTIDYTGKTSAHGDFWISKFIPSIKDRYNSTCKSIIITYTAHLFNRMNNIDIIRTASMTITNPYKYTLTQINTDNIIKYKVVNKLEKQELNFINKAQDDKPGQMIRSYYNVTNIMAKNPETGNMYTDGKMTMYLKHTNNNYMIRLYTVNEDNTRVPYDLTGNTDYKLVFPAANGSKIEVFPNKDSENYNLGIGSLIFYITGDKANSIMQVPASERYFALTTHMVNNSQEESTLYEGNVEWI